jgi:hypothetical protein
MCPVRNVLRKEKVTLKILRVFMHIFIPDGLLQGNTQTHCILKRMMIHYWKEGFRCCKFSENGNSESGNAVKAEEIIERS